MELGQGDATHQTALGREHWGTVGGSFYREAVSIPASEAQPCVFPGKKLERRSFRLAVEFSLVRIVWILGLSPSPGAAVKKPPADLWKGHGVNSEAGGLCQATVCAPGKAGTVTVDRVAKLCNLEQGHCFTSPDLCWLFSP